MTTIEKQILDLLKEGKSQNEIAKTLGVPRSLVQKTSDVMLGVSAASLKSLTVEQIKLIQSSSEEGETNASLAEKFEVSTKTVARALLVRISNHDNGVTVISPSSSLDESGEFDTSYDISPGGFAVFKKSEIESVNVYIGAHLEDRNKYLVFQKDINEQYVPSLVQYQELTPIESNHIDGFNEDLTDLAEITHALVNTGSADGEHYRIWAVVDGDKYIIKGKINAKGQIGYQDTITNMTVRVNMKSVVLFTEELPKVNNGSGEVQSTKTKLKGAALSEFLGRHQILLLPEQVVITKDGVPRTITTDHDFYQAIVDAILIGNIDDAFELMEPRKVIDRFTQGRLLLKDGKVSWDGYDVTGTGMSQRILTFAKRGEMDNVDRLTKFMDKVYQNPSAALVQSNRIYEFMAYSDIEIDEDGDILVYKSVRGNYMDKHSGTISNKPGTIVRMARSFVNDNNTELCSYGLHVCSLTYLRRCFGSNGQRVVRCKLNPKDIVSITNDYGNSKIRCCEYLVLDDYTEPYNRQYKKIDMEGIYRD